jgi:TDG/mug DNA glycosylase family protein
MFDYTRVVGQLPAGGDRRLCGIGAPPISLGAVAPEDLPLALAIHHRALPVGERVRVVFAPDVPRALRSRLLAGAGFITRGSAACRLRTLPDIVGPGMRVLVVGLNPSLFAADAGVAFARPGNRFWPAALRAGLVTRDRDPVHALVHHGVGFTDLVKRATVRASELSPGEYDAGVRRTRALVAWLRPRVVLFAGLTGYRSAVAPGAVAGFQTAQFGGVAAYVMPNPSGLNAHVRVDDLAAHLHAAASSADAIVVRQDR